MRHKPTGEPTREHGATGYRLEVRLRYGADKPLALTDGEFITRDWSDLRIYKAPLPDSLKDLALGDGSFDPLRSVLPINGMQTFEGAQASAWAFLSWCPEPERHRIEIRVVAYRVTVHTWIEKRGEVEGRILVDFTKPPQIKSPENLTTENPSATLRE